MSCLPHEVPRLMVSAQVNESSMAELLDRRLKRMEQAKVIQHQPQAVEVKPSMSSSERRFRRI